MAPTPDKILMRKIKKREKQKIKLMNKNVTDLEDNTPGNLYITHYSLF